VSVTSGHCGAVLRPVVSDMGTRVTGAMYLVASANFLGLGLGPASPDWAVTIARNEEGAAGTALGGTGPATMIVLFVVGVNLLGDDALRRRGAPLERALS
jgi:peptide/nickel transport system permease protein